MHKMGFLTAGRLWGKSWGISETRMARFILFLLYIIKVGKRKQDFLDEVLQWEVSLSPSWEGQKQLFLQMAENF